jgi:hypothetical protein
VAGKSAILTVQILSDAAKATTGTDKATASITDLGAAADKTSSKMQTSASKVDRFASSADDTEGKAAKATGALGAMASGFELIGAEEAAAHLQSAAMATDFVSGAMDSLTLLTELNSVAWLKNKAALMVSRVATLAQAAATKVLNAAMRANPIGLVITAVLLLIGGFILLYKRSETFRALIKKIGEVGKVALQAITTAAGWVVTKVTAIVSWLGRLIFPGGLKTAINQAKDAAGLLWGKVKDVVSWLGRLIFPGGFKDAVEVVKKGFDSILGLIQDVVSWLGKIDFPSPPAWMNKVLPGGNMAAPGAAGAAGPGVATRAGVVPRAVAAGPTIVINVNGAVDPEGTARQIRRILTGSDRRTGGPGRGLRTNLRVT